MDRVILFPVLLLTITAVIAIEHPNIRLDGRVGTVTGAAWQAHGIDLKLRHHDGPGLLQIAIARLTLPEPLPVLKGINLDCTDFSIDSEQLRCRTGQLRIDQYLGVPLSAQVSFGYLAATGALDFAVTELALAKGLMAIRGNMADGAWDLHLDATNLDVAQLPSEMRRLFPSVPLDKDGGHGRLVISAKLSGQGPEIAEVDFRVTSQELGFSAAAGRYAAQGLSGRLQGHWRSPLQGGPFKIELRLATGQLYLDPVFLEMPVQSPLTARVAGRWEGERLRIDSLDWHHTQILQARGTLAVQLGETTLLEQADIEIAEAAFPAVYNHYLQPLLIGTALSELQTGGHAKGRLSVSQDGLQALELELAELQLDDIQGRFGVQGLTGRLAWGQDARPRRSTLRWQQAQVYRLAIGASELSLASQAGVFRLVGQGHIPLLDGALVIDRLEGEGLGSEDLSWQFNGLLTPISMESLSAALGWPAFSGRLSGEIPDVRYADQRLAVGGALLIRLFGGEITITRLRIEDPFGAVPTVFADLDLDGLDLAALTRRFDFGRIEGKLEGHVRNLRLENWEPVQFEARFATPKGDRSRRKISQRAVENLSALGGGAGAAAVLSQGFLSMFKEFNYRRLGLSCRLANGVCEMDGVAPAPQGYYIVEGQGLPRIDVIGYTRRVDWHELLARLKAALQSQGPVIQ